MNRVVQGAQVAATVVVFVAVAGVVVVVAPLVSAVAVPIFAIRASVHWNEHRSLHDRTLTNLTREKFGRVAGQDYTRWDGRAVDQMNTNPTWAEKMHEAIGSYIHGMPDSWSEEKRTEGSPREIA